MTVNSRAVDSRRSASYDTALAAFELALGDETRIEMALLASVDGAPVPLLLLLLLVRRVESSAAAS